MSNVLDKRGFKFKYSSGIAPLVTTKEYSDLIANYKKTGTFPHILKLGGMAIDTSRNRNKWRVPFDDLQAIADQLKGAPLMKDHDIDHVDSIIGKVEDAWVEKNEEDPSTGKVMWAGETVDESMIQKILLGYVRFNSIQIAVPQAYCDNCISALGKSEEQAGIEDLDLPCPRCGSLDMLIRKPLALEQSLVAIPAYQGADVYPVGFKASVDKVLQKRFEKYGATVEAKPIPKVVEVAMPDFTPVLLSAFDAVGVATIGVAEVQLRMANMQMEGYEEEAEKGHTIAELQGRDDLTLLTDSQDVDFIKEMFSQAKDYDGFLVKVGDGEIVEVWAFEGSVPYLEKSVYPIVEAPLVSDEPEEPEIKVEAKGGSLEDFPLTERRKEKGKSEVYIDSDESVCPASEDGKHDLGLVGYGIDRQYECSKCHQRGPAN